MRVFEFGDLIPDDVERVGSPDGDEYVRAENGAFKLVRDPAELPGYLGSNTGAVGPEPLRAAWFDFEFPLMEVAV